MSDQHDDSTTKAIGALAGDIKSLTGVVESLASNQKTQQEQIGELTTTVAKTTAQSGRIPTSSIVAIVSPVLAVIALVSATGRSFVQQEIARLEIAEDRDISAIRERMQDDDIREQRDRVQFEELMSLHSAHQTKLANLETHLEYGRLHNDTFRQWYHEWLPQWGEIRKTVALLEQQQMSTDRSNAALMAGQAENRAELDAAIRRMDAINSNVGQLKSTLKP